MNETTGHEERKGGILAVGFALALELGRSFAALLARTFLSEPRPAPVRRDKRGRSGDLNLQPKRQQDSHQRWGTVFVSVAFFVSIIGGAGFVWSYWYMPTTMLLGGTLSLFLGMFGIALVLYSHWLLPDLQATASRDVLPSSTEEREDAVETFHAAVDEVPRRGLLKGMVGLALGVVAAGVVSLIRSLGHPPGPTLFDLIWKRGQRLVTLVGTPVSVNALQPGQMMIVFPDDSIGDERAQTVLIRVKEGDLDLPADRAGWAPMGYVAYSRVCTHAGCSVGMYETTTNQLMCPCHQSTFDVLKAAIPTGGPAARPLPQVPLYADEEGNLRAGGGFTNPPGPGFWGMPS